MSMSPGEKFRAALKTEKPLQLVGAHNAYMALMAEKVGYKALYLSGAGVANFSYGLPDIGLITLPQVLEDTRRVTAACGLPLLVDIDTGFGSCATIAKAIKAMIKANAAGIHIEDQATDKRCGHLSGKSVVPPAIMADRLKACLDARTDPSFVIMARCDALGPESFDSLLERMVLYKEVGCDMLFPEALTNLEQYRKIKEACRIPILANLTEFGRTPRFALEELKNAGVDIALYPLTANRAANKAALKVYEALRKGADPGEFLSDLQTRKELYYFLNYEV